MKTTSCDGSLFLFLFLLLLLLLLSLSLLLLLLLLLFYTHLPLENIAHMTKSLTRKIGTLWSDNADVHENVAEK